MKHLVYIVFIALAVFSCTTKKTFSATSAETAAVSGDTVRIANDSLQYEIIITDPGFSSWLTRAYPRNYHSQQFLENKNRFYVQEYNNRANQPQRYGSLYESQIDYDANTNYGYEVNYLLYNYFIFFQNTYKQKLWGYVPVR